jgi:hypothetical protein
MHSARHLVVAACGVSAIVHLALVPQQAADEPHLAAAFLTAALLLAVAAAVVHTRPAAPSAAAATARS